MPKLIPEIEMRVHLAKAEEFWRQDRLDLANEAMRRALKVGIPAGHFYNLQRTIEAEWGVRQSARLIKIHKELSIEADPSWCKWWDRMVSIAIDSLQALANSFNVSWSRPLLLTLVPMEDWVEFVHARYGYYVCRETVHKVCLPPPAWSDQRTFRQASRHEFTHAAVFDMGGGRVPRWFNEGLAVYTEAAGTRRLAGPKLRLGEISGGFESYDMELGSPRSHLCYSQAGEIVSRLIASHGTAAAVQYLKLICNGMDDKTSFAGAFGISEEQFEREWLEG